MKLLIDSDFLVGLFRVGDPHYRVSTQLFQHYKETKNSFHVINLVLQEAGTVLSHRVGMDAVRLYYQKVPLLEFICIDIDEGLEKRSWDIFLKQTKKGCSFVDCANLAVIEYYKLDGILSFDSFYPEKLRLIHPSM